MANCSDSIKKRDLDPEESLKSYNARPISTNKLAQYQVNRWFRSSFSAPNTKPNLRSQIRSTFIPNLSSHKATEKVTDGKPH